jgi:hypothetical protein
MKTKNIQFGYKVMRWYSVYYLIAYLLTLIQFHYIYFNNLFSGSPPDKNLSYLFQLVVFALLGIFIYVNYQIVFKEIRTSFVAVNIVFSIFQLFSFKLAKVSYLVCYGTYLGLMVGNKEGAVFQLIVQLFFPQSIISIKDNSEYWYVSVNFIPLFFIIILLSVFFKMKKTKNDMKTEIDN